MTSIQSDSTEYRTVELQDEPDKIEEPAVNATAEITAKVSQTLNKFGSIKFNHYTLLFKVIQSKLNISSFSGQINSELIS